MTLFKGDMVTRRGKDGEVVGFLFFTDPMGQRYHTVIVKWESDNTPIETDPRSLVKVTTSC